MADGHRTPPPGRLRKAVAAQLRTARSSRLHSALTRRLGIDVRALAAFRMAVALVLLADLGYRTRDLTAFYTDTGVVPRAANAVVYPTLSTFSIHALSGAAWFQWLLFGGAGLAAALLLVGYRTRTAAVASWGLLASLQFRNYLVLNGGDTVLLVALFIALFLPLGERWSLDAVLAHGPGRRGTGAGHPGPQVVGFGTAALLSNIVLIYATNAVYKLRSDAWTSGDAIPTVYQVDRFTVLLGEFIAREPAILEGLTYGWLTLLVASPLLILLTGSRRTVLTGAFATAHLGMYLTLDLGFFPHAMGACLLLFLPPSVWGRVEAAVAPVRTVLTVRFGGTTDPRRDPFLSARLRASLTSLRSVATMTILVVGLLWQGVALGYVAAPDDSPIDPVEHSWKLFAPNPPSSDGWFVVNGTLASGRSVDLYPHADTRDDPPPDSADTYPSTRWRKYLAEVRTDPTVRRYFADYLCRWGADRYGASVDSLRITYIRESVLPDGPPGRTRVDLGRYQCPVVA